MSTSRIAELMPPVVETVIWSDQITPYDQQHFITYARLLDAEAGGADWQEVARVVLQQDPDKEPERAHRCWQMHLERARWVTTTGYRQLLEAVAPNENHP